MVMLENNRGMGIANVFGLYAVLLPQMPLLLVSNERLSSVWTIAPFMDYNGCRIDSNGIRYNCSNS
jgi:hypothetical protein